MGNKFYITTSIVYTNGPVHVGYAFELIQADVLARYHRLQGENVWFLTGTDEHGLTVQRAAQKAGRKPEEFVNQIADQVQELTKKLGISNDDFIRTSNQKKHWSTPIKLWQILFERGDIYKSKYRGLYCIGHESFIKKNDLVDSLCPLHKTRPENIEEENWFFRLTKYKDGVRKRIENGELEILPETRKKEVLNLFDDAEDVSISRPKSVLTWGIPVPGDSDSTIYVWFEALTSYISALDYAGNGNLFSKFWPADVHLIGKDILRFHALIWPAILLAAGIELPKKILVHGFITAGGEKMSKTTGNVTDPFEIVNKYGVDPVRYFLLREIPSDEDGDFSEKKLVERYNGDLANGLGNLVRRVVTLIETGLDGELVYKKENDENISGLDGDYHEAIKNFKFHEALGEIWKKIAQANTYVDHQKPWVEIKEDPAEFLKTMTTLIASIHNITWLLKPFLPETANKITAILGADNIKEIKRNYKFIIKKGGVLFPKNF